jgi:pyrroloquinoline quinone biosynthesis protein A
VAIHDHHEYLSEETGYSASHGDKRNNSLIRNPQRIEKELIMWTKPEVTEMRFGFEVTMYVCNR